MEGCGRRDVFMGLLPVRLEIHGYHGRVGNNSVLSIKVFGPVANPRVSSGTLEDNGSLLLINYQVRTKFLLGNTTVTLTWGSSSIDNSFSIGVWASVRSGSHAGYQSILYAYLWRLRGAHSYRRLHRA